jgi:hypothetical protein
VATMKWAFLAVLGAALGAACGGNGSSGSSVVGDGGGSGEGGGVGWEGGSGGGLDGGVGPTDAHHVTADGALVCSTDADCPSGPPLFLYCSPGGQTTGGGPPSCGIGSQPCNVTTDCSGGDASPPTMLCQPAPSPVCSPMLGGKSGFCVPACQCSPDEMCTSTGQCVAKGCMKDADCPVDGISVYACSSGTCAPKTCSTDADCGGTNYCVSKSCFTEQGLCVQPAA